MCSSLFAGVFGEMVDRGEYLIVRTPNLPGFFLDNFLLFANPPGSGDFDRWRERFRFNRF